MYRLLLTTLLICSPSLASAQLEKLRDLTGSELARAAKPRLMRRSLVAAGAPTIEVRRNYVYVLDNDGLLRAPFQSEQDLQDALELAASSVYQVLPDEFVFIYVFTSF